MCARFIEEFGKEYVYKRGVIGISLDEQSLVIDDNEECVRMSFEMNDRQGQLVVASYLEPIYHPEGNEEYLVERLAAELFLKPAAILNRLVKANLVDE